MSTVVRSTTYIALVLWFGGAVFCTEFAKVQLDDFKAFSLYILIASAGSLMKVRLPEMTGSMSVNFIFILIGIADATLVETLLVGIAGMLIQCFWHARSRPKVVQVCFNLAVAAIAIKAAHTTYWLSLQRGYVGLPVVMAATALVYFIMNTLPVATAISVTENKSLRKTWKECSLWYFPVYMMGAVVAGIYCGSAPNARWQVMAVFIPLVYMVYRAYGTYLLRLRKEQQNSEEVAALHLRTIEALALSIKAREGSDYRELRRTQIFAVELGKELGLADGDMKALRAACLLRDIGNMAIPGHILAKPEALTPAEQERVRAHPIVGAGILEWVRFPYPVVSVVRAHHEKWDGTGYPHGLRQTEIPIGARILSAVDALIALTSDRPHRPAMSLDDAMRHLTVESNTSFDPVVIHVLAERYHELDRAAEEALRLNEPGSETSDYKDAQALYQHIGVDSPDESPGTSGHHALASLNSMLQASEESRMLAHFSACDKDPLTLAETLAVFAMRLKKIVPYDTMVVYVQSGDVLVPTYVSGDDSRLLWPLKIPVGEGLSGWVAHTRKSVLNENPSALAGRQKDKAKPALARSVLSVPLEAVDGTVGVITLYSGKHNAFTRDHLRVILGVRLRLLDQQLLQLAS